MTIDYKVSGRGDIIYKYINKMKNDEHLMRLLYYAPFDEDGNFIDFTDMDLPNVLDLPQDELIFFQDDVIRKSQKADDIIENKKTVIFIYYGKSKPVFENKTLVKREIIFHILSHNDFAVADRIEEICDRLDTLFVGKRIAGIGKTDIANSFPREAPKEYLAYEHKYIVLDKRW